MFLTRRGGGATLIASVFRCAVAPLREYLSTAVYLKKFLI